MATERKIIYIAGFLFAIPVALTSYVNSSFLGSFINSSYVGIIYVGASILTILGMLEMPKMLTKLGNRKTTLLFVFLALACLLTLAFSQNIFVVVGAFALFFIAANFVSASLDIFIEDFSQRRSVGKLRGLYLMVINGAWVVSQTISGSVIAKSSYEGIYLFSAGFVILVAIIFIMFLRNFVDPKYTKVPVVKTVRFFLQNKNISRIYFINLLLKIFFSWMIIYTPIYLHEYLLFDWSEIGTIFTIMLIPFVILDFPLGKLSDKIGEKKLLILGFSIISIFTFLIPFLREPEVWLWASVLFMTRVGAAAIEVMSENYFFKSVSEENADEISFFRNTGPLSFIIGPLLATMVLLLVPSFSYLFFVLALLMLSGLTTSLQLKDVK